MTHVSLTANSNLTMLTQPFFETLIFPPCLNASQGNSFSKRMTELRCSEPVEFKISVEIATTTDFLEETGTPWTVNVVFYRVVLYGVKGGDVSVSTVTVRKTASF